MEISKFRKFNESFEYFEDIEKAMVILPQLEEIFLEIEDDFSVEVYCEFHKFIEERGSINGLFKAYFSDRSSPTGYHGAHGYRIVPYKNYFRIFIPNKTKDNKLYNHVDAICNSLDQKLNRTVNYLIHNDVERGPVGKRENRTLPTDPFLSIKDYKVRGIEVILYID